VRKVPALIWSLAGAIYEKRNTRKKIRLKAIYDAIKLMMGYKIYDPVF
jgi:hypothetical protein